LVAQKVEYSVDNWAEHWVEKMAEQLVGPWGQHWVEKKAALSAVAMADWMDSC